MNFSVYDAPMPTKNPRLTITLKPSLAATLRRLSEITGNSQSSIIAEALDGTEAVFARVVQVLEAAEKAKAQLRGRSAKMLDRAQAQIEGQLSLLMGEFDKGADRSLEALQVLTREEPEAATGRRETERKRRHEGGAATSEAPAGGKLTPLSNRGVRSMTSTRKQTPQGGRNGAV